MSIDEELAQSLPIQPGMTIGGKYRIEKLLAAGGMGAVLKAHHEILDKAVAIKLIRPELASRREVSQRFLREARAAAKITSEYVGRVTDVDLFDDKTPFIVMEFLEGEDLHDAMSAQGRLPVALAVDYTLQALLGLDAAHAKGVVHRDLKPSNLFLERRDDGGRRVKLLDFGISKILDGEGDHALKAGATTSAGQMLGTPRYMSPEQVADAKSVDGRTDLWAVGLILYEMLTGAYPFEGSSSGQILAAILTAPIRPLRELREEVPIELEEVLVKCLAKDRGNRYPSARAMMRALAPFGSRRMRAIALEHDDVAGDGVETARSPDAVRDPSGGTPAGTKPASPVGLTVATRVADDAMRSSPQPDGPTELDTASRGASTRVSAGEPARSPVAPPSTDAGVSVAESARAGRSTGRMVIVGAAAVALAAGIYLAVRGPGPSPAQSASSSAATSAPMATTEPATNPTTSQRPAPSMLVEAVGTVMSASASSAPTSGAASAVSSIASSSARAPAATTPKAKPTAQPPTTSGGMIRTRD